MSMSDMAEITSTFTRLQQRAETDHDTFVALRTVLDLVESMGPTAPHAAQSLTETEIEAFEAAGISVTAASPTARARLFARRAQADQRLLSTTEFAERAHLSDSHVRQRLGERTLYGVKRATSWLVPDWQISPTTNHVIDGLQIVIPTVPAGLGVQSVEGLMTTPNPNMEVDGTPVSLVEWLDLGGDPEVAVGYTHDASLLT